mmetsp:Transcript_3668/g.5659  ORF Transcript_3668/g.5659 Transcript_3668/m.5659 type:complete len:786 (+) Transcript_3668:120-2477(+)
MTQRSCCIHSKMALRTPKFPKLFTPLNLDKAGTLKNRIIMGSMHTGLEGHSIPKILQGAFQNPTKKLERLAQFYAERAKGGVGLIITGGFSPNSAGTLYPLGSKLDSSFESDCHRIVTQAVRENSVCGYPYPKGSPYTKVQVIQNSNDFADSETEDYETKICLQILHAGRYAAHPFAVSSTDQKSPISPFPPKKLGVSGVASTIRDFVDCADFAKEAGYHGVEIMGSEGYFINQFLSPCTNPNASLDERLSLPVNIVRGIREACGDDFIIIYRISLADLVENGMPWEEVIELAQRLDESVSIFNAGIGWHESRVPTIATMVPRATWSWTVEKLKKSLPSLSTPISVTNRINAPHTAEKLLDVADLVTMARPFLADELFPIKAYNGNEELINTCIGCNQACLDHVFKGKTASCLVNPHACNEGKFNYNDPILPSGVGGDEASLKVAVIGAGPAGLSFALTARKLGHDVTIIDKSSDIGGQFNIAKLIPGKQEFYETLKYFTKHLDLFGVDIKLNHEVSEANIGELMQYDKVVVATGVNPRIPAITGVDHEKVISYYDLLSQKRPVGKKVAVLGAGGIGFDVADYLLHSDEEMFSDLSSASPADDVSVGDFLSTWGIDTEQHTLLSPAAPEKQREIYLMQRKSGKLGAGLGKTTGWIHRTTLKNHGVNFMNAVKYDKIDDDGLHITVGKSEEKHVLDVDNVILCTGQEPNRDLLSSLQALFDNESSKDQKKVYMIGGAYKAGELDAKRAIDMGMRLAFRIHENSVNEDDLEETPSTEEKLMSLMQKK